MKRALSAAVFCLLIAQGALSELILLENNIHDVDLPSSGFDFESGWQTLKPPAVKEISDIFTRSLWDNSLGGLDLFVYIARSQIMFEHGALGMELAELRAQLNDLLFCGFSPVTAFQEFSQIFGFGFQEVYDEELLLLQTYNALVNGRMPIVGNDNAKENFIFILGVNSQDGLGLFLDMNGLIYLGQIDDLKTNEIGDFVTLTYLMP